MNLRLTPGVIEQPPAILINKRRGRVESFM